MKYLLITKSSAPDLSEAVSHYLALGWKLYGQSFIFQDGQFTFYAQAVILEQ